MTLKKGLIGKRRKNRNQHLRKLLKKKVNDLPEDNLSKPLVYVDQVAEDTTVDVTSPQKRLIGVYEGYQVFANDVQPDVKQEPVDAEFDEAGQGETDIKDEEKTVKTVVENLLQQNEVLPAQNDAETLKPNPSTVEPKSTEQCFENYGSILTSKDPTVSCSKADMPNINDALVEVNFNKANKTNCDSEHVCAVGSKVILMTSQGQMLQMDITYYWCNFCSYKSEKKATLLQHAMEHRFHCNYCKFQSFTRAAVIHHCTEEHESFADTATTLTYCKYLPDLIQKNDMKKRKQDGQEADAPEAKRARVDDTELLNMEVEEVDTGDTSKTVEPAKIIKPSFTVSGKSASSIPTVFGTENNGLPVISSVISGHQAVSAALTSTVSQPELEPTPKPPKNIAPQPQKNIAPQPQKNIAPQPQKNITPQPQKNITPQPQKNITPQRPKIIAPQPQKNITPQRPKIIAPQPQKNITPQPQKIIAPQPPKIIAPQPQKNTAPKPQKKTTPQPQKNIIPQHQKNITPQPQKNITPPPQKNITPPPQKNITPQPQKNITPQSPKIIAPQPQKNITPQPPKIIAPQPQKNITPQPQKNITPQPQKNITPQPPKIIAPQPQKNITPQPQKNITPQPPKIIAHQPQKNITHAPAPPSTPVSSSASSSASGVTVSAGLCWKCMYCWFDTLNQAFLKIHLNAQHRGRKHRYVSMLVLSEEEMARIKASDAQVVSNPSDGWVMVPVTPFIPPTLTK